MTYTATFPSKTWRERWGRMAKAETNHVEENLGFKIGEAVLRDVCFYFYRGWLRVDDDGDYYVGPGQGLVVEVYDRCDESIWFETSNPELGGLVAEIASAVDAFEQLEAGD